MHVYTGEAKQPPHGTNTAGTILRLNCPACGSTQIRAPSNSLLRMYFCQHVIVAYGDYSEHLRDFCRLNGIDLVM